jgi:hypothetical protein
MAVKPAIKSTTLEPPPEPAWVLVALALLVTLADGVIVEPWYHPRAAAAPANRVTSGLASVMWTSQTTCAGRGLSNRQRYRCALSRLAVQAGADLAGTAIPGERRIPSQARRSQPADCWCWKRPLCWERVIPGTKDR